MAFQALAAASFGTSLLSNYSQLQSTLDQADSLVYQASRFDYKAERSKLAAESARTQTKLNNTILQENYNETQANQAVKFAMQGRTGATVANIIKQDQQNLNWDKKFMELSGIIEATNYELDAIGYKKDAAQSKQGAAEKVKSGYRNQAIGLLSSGLKSAQLF